MPKCFGKLKQSPLYFSHYLTLMKTVQLILLEFKFIKFWDFRSGHFIRERKPLANKFLIVREPKRTGIIRNYLSRALFYLTRIEKNKVVFKTTVWKIVKNQGF